MLDLPYWFSLAVLYAALFVSVSVGLLCIVALAELLADIVDYFVFLFRKWR